jgi:uncharacterized protein
MKSLFKTQKGENNMLSDYRFIIIHGAMGYPGENWFPWLAEQLSQEGAKAMVPAFPTPEGQSLDKWLEILNAEAGKLDDKTVLVGHSLGNLFILRVLERAKAPIKAAFLVAALTNQALGIKDFDAINTTFYHGDLHWDRIRSNCGAFYNYHSDNDPYIPLARGQEVADNLHTNLNIIKGAGHFNATAGYTKFDRLLADIKKSIL